MTFSPTWDELGRAAAKEANEQLRRSNELGQQMRSNDTLGEIRDILKAMLDAQQEDTLRYREQAAHNADIARQLMNTVNDREEEILHLRNEVFNLRERIRMYMQETNNGG
jgi:hypothetical protein